MTKGYKTGFNIKSFSSSWDRFALRKVANNQWKPCCCKMGLIVHNLNFQTSKEEKVYLNKNNCGHLIKDY